MRFAIRWAIPAFFIFAAVTDAADDKSATPPANKDAKKYTVVDQRDGKLVKVNSTSQEAVVEVRMGLGKYARTERMELTFADDVKVWHTKPPEKIDENGNSKKLSPSDLEKIKGHTKETRGLYQGELADLHEGQVVRIVLGKPKDAPKKPATREKGAAAEKEFVYVTQVVITAEEKAPTKSDKKKP
jgi:hypothetical protein